jgi:hypothetical protein
MKHVSSGHWLYMTGNVLLFSVVLLGCGATSFDDKLPESVTLPPGGKLELLPIENSTGHELTVRVDQIFNDYMMKRLREREILHTSVDQPATFVLKTKLIEYEEGSAAGRWLLPGLGTTICTVYAELLDKQTGAVKGSLTSRQTVSVGGLYSVGAENYICERCADEIVAKLDKDLLGKKNEG